MNASRIVPAADLLDAHPDQAYLRWSLPEDAVVARAAQGWAWIHRWRPHGHWGGGAFSDAALSEPAGSGTGAGTGAPDWESEAFALLEAHGRATGHETEWFSTTPGRELRAPSGARLGAGGCWQWWWTDRVPEQGPPSGGPRILELDDDRDATEIQEFGAAHNADFEGFPGRGFATCWLATRDRAGELTSVGAIHHLATGAPHLAGIVVRPDLRGQGLGRHLTRALTERAVTGHGVATLGVYTANAAALGLYRALGYRCALDLHTRSVHRD